MSTSSPILDFFTMNGARLPYFLVYLVGFVLALATWRRHPLASLLSAIAFVLFSLGNILAIAASWYVLRMAGFTGAERSFWMSAGNYLFTALGLGGWILILIALFARRPQQPGQWTPAGPERYERRFPEPGGPAGPSREDIQR